VGGAEVVSRLHREDRSGYVCFQAPINGVQTVLLDCAPIA
jgi:hypothetical protein